MKVEIVLCKVGKLEFQKRWNRDKHQIDCTGNGLTHKQETARPGKDTAEKGGRV